MRFLELSLPAFGPFTNAAIPLHKGQEGLHILFGRNEAGKTTILRAVDRLLFGFESRERDDWRHEMQRLRVGASLRSSDGSEWSFVRRRGQKSTLLGADGKSPADEAELRRLLGGLDRATFSAMFSIDHEELVRGGRDVLEGKGDVGKILFAAGTGLSGLRAVLANLHEDASALYRPRAQRTLNKAIHEYSQKKKELTTLSASVQQWEACDQDVLRVRERRSEVAKQIEALQIELQRRCRILDALPHVARRRELLQKKDEWSGAPQLSPDFRTHRTQTMTEREHCQRAVRQSKEKLASVFEELDRTPDPSSILRHSETIEALYRELGSIEKASRDRREVYARLQQATRDIEEMSRALAGSLDLELASHAMTMPQETRVRELARGWERLTTKLENSAQVERRKKADVERLEKQLADLGEIPSFDQLECLVNLASKAGDGFERFDDDQFALKRDKEELTESMRQWSVWQGELDELADLILPTEQELEDRIEAMENAQSLAGEHTKELKTLGEKIRGVERQLADLVERDGVPSEEEMIEARRNRDRGWHLVRQSWRDGKEPPQADLFITAHPPARDIGEAFQDAVRRADQVADRLRREADRVARRASLSTELDDLHRQEDHAQTQLQASMAEQGRAEERWSELWTRVGAKADAPRVMRAWRADALHVRGRLKEWRVRAEDLSRRRHAIEGHVAAFTATLAALGHQPIDANLSPLVAQANQILCDLRDRKKRSQELSNRLVELRSEWELCLKELGAANESLDAHRAIWQETINSLSLPPNAIAEEVIAILDGQRGLKSKLTEKVGFEERLAGIDRDASDFTERVLKLSRELAVSPNEDATSSVRAIYQAWNEAKTQKERRESLLKQQLQLGDQIREQQAELARLDAQLSELCQQAECGLPDELPDKERLADLRRRWCEEWDRLEDRLRELSRGATVDAFVEEIGTIDGDAMSAAIAEHQRILAELEGKRSKLDEEYGRAEAELERISGDGRAAELAEDMQSLAADMDRQARRYLRLTLGAHILEQAIERYRQENEGPILRRASEIFRHLTLGSFEKLCVKTSTNGKSILVGYRQGNNTSLTIDQMSEGTADQLYLAIRLASLENHLDHHEPLPLLVDDILVNFDDHRALAALDLLGELSSRTQVLFFTHHRHLVDLAQARLDSDILFVHDLNEVAAAAVGHSLVDS